MVSYVIVLRFLVRVISVLILIVVEDGLVRRVAWNTTRKALRVLILIVVEDGLVLGANVQLNSQDFVLILIVVEDGLVRDVNHSAMTAAQMS